MRKRWIWALVLPVAAVAAAVAAYAGPVRATPQLCFSSTPLLGARPGTFGEIVSKVKTEVPQEWEEEIKTEGASDLYVQQNTWTSLSACGGHTASTGWHTHPGPSLVTVTEGSVAVYDGDDPTCTPHVYTAGTANNAFVDPGGGHVHLIRNATDAEAQTIAVQLVPAGTTMRRQDASDPGNCSFPSP